MSFGVSWLIFSLVGFWLVALMLDLVTRFVGYTLCLQFVVFVLIPFCCGVVF